MQQKQTVLTSRADGISISVICGKPDSGEAKAIFQIAHGMSEHKERYLPLMEYLCAHGYACVIHDHRGHGESVAAQKDLGYLYDGGAEALVEDLHQVTEYAKAEFPGKPLVLFGHSMGSMVVRAYLKRYDSELAGLIVCGSPSYNPAARLGRLLAKIIGAVKGGRYRSRLLQQLSFGSFSRRYRAEGSDNAWTSSLRESVQAYDNDPLCGFTFTANGFYHLYGLMLEAYGKTGWQMRQPGLPILFLSGADDPCLINEVKFQKAVSFLRERGYANVDAKLYPGKRHELLNEDIRLTVFEDILTFCEQLV